MVLSNIPWYINKKNNQFIDNQTFGTIAYCAMYRLNMFPYISMYQRIQEATAVGYMERITEEDEHGNKVVWSIMFYVNDG